MDIETQFSASAKWEGEPCTLACKGSHCHFEMGGTPKQPQTNDAKQHLAFKEGGLRPDARNVQRKGISKMERRTVHVE